ncbi:MAG: alpha/beta fold hydrolase [Rhodobacteraceae bacterium]|nr:alpha/beta fold hydrolase [Paracoccaceae bacterium]
MEDAPLNVVTAEGPAGGRAYWIRTSDGVRLRAAHWPGGTVGTVLLFPGRTEYVEKYGRVAADLVAAGYHVLSIDWRGQGLSDRLHPDPRIGHVEAFADYQNDVAALLALAEILPVPAPRFLLAHSIGGAIGLRALHQGLSVNATAFCSPMWKINVAIAVRPFARWISYAMRSAGRGLAFVPGRSGTTMRENPAFDDNGLTNDRNHWAYMVAQVQADEGLALGGPSVRWFDEALRETRALRALGPPRNRPTLTGIGTADSIVDVAAPRAMMKNWPDGDLLIYEDAQHELLMEVPNVRSDFVNATLHLFQNHH